MLLTLLFHCVVCLHCVDPFDGEFGASLSLVMLSTDWNNVPEKKRGNTKSMKDQPKVY